ncbi:hypothetical protein DYU11_01980 [Fibrisoma montanum]|uniref:Uncharacterized protein n=1 Tax=Fibrisoma montanum TaxID=2305895 RepID=A0A418MI59_9BACT|nr:hypothetical protein [Fibrisoma montanum]RIV27109.1 hypothetical protein DYU11_01980 [Fibrisoma montanum]
MWDTLLYLTMLGVCTVLYVLNYRILTPPLQALTLAITATFVITGYGVYVWRVENRDNLYVFHFLPVAQYVAYGLMFRGMLAQTVIQRLISVTIVLFSVVSFGISLTIQPWNQYNSYALTLFNTLIAYWAGHYLWRIFIDSKISSLEKEPLFWISAGLFFTSLGNFFVQGLMNYMISVSNQYALLVYWIQELMNFIVISIFLLALRVYLKQKLPIYTSN